MAAGSVGVADARERRASVAARMEDFHSGWTDYYEENADREPRALLLETLDAFGDAGGEAVDLGCGAGIDTNAILRRGWSVLAVDEQQEAIDRLRARVPADVADRLRTAVAPMEDVAVPPVDLVWASFSLFFCRPGRFADSWRGITGAIRSGGRFAGHILGDRDTWASRDDISAFPIDRARALFDRFEIERFEESEEDGDPGPKHWHVFEIRALRP